MTRAGGSILRCVTPSPHGLRQHDTKSAKISANITRCRLMFVLPLGYTVQLQTTRHEVCIGRDAGRNYMIQVSFLLAFIPTFLSRFYVFRHLFLFDG